MIPPGFNIGDRFRVLFVTSTSRDAQSSDIADYNGFVQGRANAGHRGIRSFSGQFRAVACTRVDARDNTATTGSGGVPIYWLNGDKAADNYGDFYDDSWDSRSARNERGRQRSFFEQV